MCIIFHKPQGIVLSEEVLENCFTSNSHGAGFMVAKDGELIIKKGFFSFASFMEAYEEYKNENVVAHFRWATHGEKNEENCHPFQVVDGLGFAHNGVLTGMHVTGSDKSDTWHFNEKVLKEICSKFEDAWRDKTLKFLIMKKIGVSNKLVFLHKSGKVAIYNSEKGTKKLGCWFSNDDFEKRRTRTTNSTTSSYHYGNHHRGHYDNDFDDYGGHGHRFDSSKKNTNTTPNLNESPNESDEKKNKLCVGSRIFIDTPTGLVELSRTVLEEIGNENQDVICDDCNRAFSKDKLTETSNLRMCNECIVAGSTV